MADKKVTVTIEAVDKASQVIAEVSKQLESLSGIGKGGGFKNLANLGGAVKVFQKIDKITRKGGGLTAYKNALSEVGTVAGTIFNGTLSFGSSFLELTGDVANADLSLQGIIKTGLNYDQTLERIKIKAGATGKEMTNLDKAMRQMAAGTVYAMDDVASAAELMAQNGRSATEIMQQLPDVLTLATAGNLDLARAGEIVAGTMNMFAKQGITSADVANMLGTAANSSGADVNSLAKTLENCGPQAVAMNIPFHEVIGTISLLGDTMIKGGKAGTTLKNLFQRMNTPTKAAGNAIKEFGLETAQAYIQNGQLGKGLIEMQNRFKELEKTGKKSRDEINGAMKDIAGSYGSAGLSALMDIDPAEILARFKAIKNGVVDVDSLMNTVSGKMMIFAANIQLLAYDIAKSFEGGFTAALNVLNNFMSKLNQGEGLTSAFKYLEQESAKLPKILSDAIGNAIDTINNFVNGGSLASIFQIGTNIITGICDGIINNPGKINEAVSGFISQFCDFINTNGPQIDEAAGVILDAIKNGIQNNQGKIDEAATTVMNLLNTSLGGQQSIILELGRTIAVPLGEGFIQGAAESFMNIGGEITQFIVFGLADVGTALYDFGFNLVGEMWKGFTDWNSQNAPRTVIDSIKNAWNSAWGGTQTNTAEAGTKTGTAYTSKTGEAITNTSGVVNQSATAMADGAATTIENRLNNMNVEGLKALETEFTNLQTTTGTVASGIATNFTNITNSARTNFLGLANIIRNQMTNITKAIGDGMKGARSSFTTQFISMRKVAGTQSTLIRTAIVNKFMSIRSVITTQMSSARSALTSQFISMRKVAATQMAEILRTVNSYMSQISAACNKTMTLKVNINKTETTTKKVVVEGGGKTSMMNIAVPQTSSFTASGTRGASNSIGLGSLAQALSGYGKDQTISISVPVVLEGREIAKASAIYTREELSRLEKRNNRKRGE